MITGQETARPVRTAHLQAWSDERSTEAARQVAEMMESPGWAALMEATESFRLLAYSYLETKGASDSAAEYAQVVGESKGVAMIESIAAGIVRNAEIRAEAQARQAQEEN